jgi:uncharacterized small protein (DUF1192 family)
MDMSGKISRLVQENKQLIDVNANLMREIKILKSANHALLQTNRIEVEQSRCIFEKERQKYDQKVRQFAENENIQKATIMELEKRINTLVAEHKRLNDLFQKGVFDENESLKSFIGQLRTELELT